jgi:hypothetical protein
MMSMREWAEAHGIPQSFKPTEEEEDEQPCNEDWLINPEA